MVRKCHHYLDFSSGSFQCDQGCKTYWEEKPVDDHRNKVAEAFEQTVEGRRFRWEFVVVAVGVFYILAHVLVWWQNGFVVSR